jgi:hypothetical protein
VGSLCSRNHSRMKERRSNSFLGQKNCRVWATVGTQKFANIATYLVCMSQLLGFLKIEQGR